LINAGHLPVLWMDAAGRLRQLDSTGPALGLLPDARFEAHHFGLSGGDTLLAYSDGVTEALNAEGEEFGSHRIVELMTPANLNAAALCERLVDHVRQFTSGQAGDDVSVLAVRRVPLQPVEAG
jgi:sigma-B regulation protein RsbU (phosphoserine phosphatase)